MGGKKCIPKNRGSLTLGQMLTLQLNIRGRCSLRGVAVTQSASAVQINNVKTMLWFI